MMQPQNMPNSTLLDSLLDQARARLTGRRPLQITGLQAGAKAWLLATLARPWDGRMVVICDSLIRAETLCLELAFFDAGRPVLLFPHWDTVPYDSFSPNTETMAQRFAAMAALADGAPGLLVTTVQAWMQGMMPPHRFEELRFGLRVGERHPRTPLLERLVTAGYVRVDLVEAPGEFSARGDIVDVYPISDEHPARLDFFDDELETIRKFEVGSQKSFAEMDEVRIFPASEVVINSETAGYALRQVPHYKGQLQPETYRQLFHCLHQGSAFPGAEQMMSLFYEQAGWLHEALPRDAVVVVDEAPMIQATAENYYSEVLGEQEFNIRQGNLALPPEQFYLSPTRLKEELLRFYQVETQALRLEEGPGTLVAPFADNSALRGPAAVEGQGLHATLEQMLGRLVNWRDAGAPVLIAARSQTGAEKLRHLMTDFEVATRVVEADPALFDPHRMLRQPASGKDALGDITVIDRTPHRGFRVVDQQGETRFALITEEELLGEKSRQRRLKKSKLHHFIASLGELKEGDLVVHVEYGVGQYEGLRRLQAGGADGDFLQLAYAGGDKVYVPVARLNQVQKFTAVEGALGQMNKLGDGAWQRSKVRASKAIADMAEELVAVQAARQDRPGHAYPPNETLMTEFEEAFDFQETEDQQAAIADVLADLMNETPMDRLVCGDVGFGKTEVAMRAAYLAALDGMQVMILVPTTILAQQHYETFTRRFEPFPVVVDVLSRFRVASEQKQVARAFSEGRVDILIGTHRLLSKDVSARTLGLLVIDEEQRFGVAHKEKIKRLKNEVEVLALSATPIPRTLHMSLMGVRDLSIINTPPMDRIAVRTRLVKSSDYIITEAVEREVRRGGQVFVVQNRVEHIHQFGTYIQSLLPHLRIAIAHGQMPEKQLEGVMVEFVNGDLDVLVSTSIIESGLDIPRANTIIINNADRFGLSQLYQLRGRVGRSNVQAYAYLLVSPGKMLTDVAQKRLTLLQELNDLGSGFKIASHDLEIRGAGNLMGREQSGHINSIGLELFTQMVEAAVGKLKGAAASRLEELECKLELGFPYLLPEEYIASTRQRLDVYKQLAEIRSEGDLWEFRQSLEDRFGKIPPDLGALFVLIQVRLAAMKFGLSLLENSQGMLAAKFGRPERIDLERLLILVSDSEAGMRLLPGDRLVLGPMPGSPEGVLEKLNQLEPALAKDLAAA